MTLVELMVSLSIILVVMAVATAAYLKLMRAYRTESKISQNYMANLTGFELLRYDVQMAGFGLPWDVSGVAFSEAAAVAVTPANPYDPATLNDAGAVPRAVLSLNNTGANNSDVLTIKSSMANLNSASKKWSMITYNTAAAVPRVKPWGGTASLDSSLDFVTNDRVIVLNNSDTTNPNQLIVNGGSWCGTFDGTTPIGGYYSDATNIANGLTTPDRVYFAYGLDTIAGAHRMPFNRVDYYLNRVAGEIPTGCADNTYTLYRANILQDTGARNPAPLIDCVRDFQVAFGLDVLDNGNITWVTNLAGMSASTIREQLREIRVFVLYHEGTGDASSKSKEYRTSATLTLGDASTGNLSAYTPANQYTAYRWKVVQMAIKPMNLKK